MPDKWITIGKKSEEGKGRRVLLDENGNIVGGNLPKTMQGKHISNYKNDIKKAHAKLKGEPEPSTISSHEPTPQKRSRTKAAAEALKTLPNTKPPVAHGNASSLPGNTSKQSEHYSLKNWSKDMAKKLGVKPNALTVGIAMEASLGVTKEEGTGIYNAINTYLTGGHYKKISQAEMKGEDYNDASKNLSTFIDKSPKWKTTLFRGMSLTPEDISNLTVGSTIDMRGTTSSWTDNDAIAKKFGNYARKHDTREKKKTVLFECEPGTRSASIAHLSNFPKEQEVIMHKDQKLVIKEIVKPKSGPMIVKVGPA